MKCDELKPLLFSLNELAFIDESAVQKDFENPHDHAVYKATEVDAAIAELKAQVNGFENRANLWEYNARNEHNAAVAVRMENKKLEQKLQDQCTSCPVKMQEDDVVAEKDKEIAELKESRQAWIARAEVTEENLAKLEKELAELREATRWRDVEKEPPEIKEESEEVAILVEYENNYSRGVFVTHSDFYKGVFYETHLDNDINFDYDNDGERCYQKVIKWQPMPKAPEEAK